MAGNKVGLINKVRSHNLVLAKAQMACGDGTGFLGVVYEVTLGTVRCFGTDDLNGVLVSADCTVCTQAEEHGPENIITFDIVGFVVVKAGISHIVIRSDTEMIFRSPGSHVIIDSFYHGRGKFSRTKAVAAGKDHGLQVDN